MSADFAKINPVNGPMAKQGTISAADDMQIGVDALSVPETGEETKEIYEKNMRAVTKGVIEQSVIDRYFSGFNKLKKQGFISYSDTQKVLADENTWKNGEIFKFKVDPGNNNSSSPTRGWNPYMTLLILTGKFEKSDGTAIDDTTAPCNLWQIRMFDKVDESNINHLSYSPAETDLPGNEFKEMAYLIPNDNMGKIPLTYHKANVKEAKRSAKEGDTNPGLNERCGKNAAWIAEKSYAVPLRYLCNSAERNCIDFDASIFTLKRHKDTAKYMESKEKQAPNDDRSVKVGGFKITQQPYLLVHNYTLTPNAQNLFTNTYAHRGEYRYGSHRNFTMLRQQLSPNVTSHTFQFQNYAAQFDFLRFHLIQTEAYEHNSVYDSYDNEMATEHIKKLSFLGIAYSEFNGASLIYNPGEEFTDQTILHQNFLGYLTDSPSDAPVDSYLPYQPTENLPSQEDYFAGGYPLVVDLRDSRGYTGDDEPINRTHSNMSVTVTLKDPVPNGRTWELICMGINKADYKRQETNQGTTIQRIERTLASLDFPITATKEPTAVYTGRNLY